MVFWFFTWGIPNPKSFFVFFVICPIFYGHENGVYRYTTFSYRPIDMVYPLDPSGNDCYIAIENGHGNSGLTH